MTSADEANERKQRGGVPLEVGVSDRTWLGGIRGEVATAPFVYVGPVGWEGEEELTFFSDRASVEAFVAKLREAADRAWPAR